MRCFSVRKRLSPYIDGELRARQASKLESHLAGCQRCAADYQELAGVHGLFAGAQRFSAPQGFSAAVMEKVEARSAKTFSLVPLLVRFAGAAAVVLAIAAGAVSGDVLTNSLVPHRRPEGETVMASLSLDAFEASPPGSLGHGYLSVMGDRR
jgi:anti-sigma factor RsiW